MTQSFPVPQESVEAGLLNAVNQNTERWLAVAQFSSDDFSAHRDIFRFFKTYLDEYGSLPSASQISTRFQDWSPPIGDFEYWYKEMQRYSMARKVLEVMQEGFGQVSEPQRALTTLIDKLSLIRSANTNHIQATDGSALERLERFDYRTEAIFSSNEVLGIRTGHKIIDDSQVGWVPGSLVGCFARPGVGKSWWLLWQGVNAWIQGFKILVISPEMPANMLNLRIDTLFGGALGVPINYNMLLIGDPAIRENYETIVHTISTSQRWWCYDSIDERSISVSDIGNLCRLHEPDLVLVDGVSLLRNDSRGQTWEQMKENCYGLKNLATIREIPIIMTHQAVNSARGRRSERGTIFRGDDDLMPSLNDVAFGDAFVQACSDVITMCGEPQSQYINWYSIRKYRDRGWQQELPTRMGLGVDFARGRIVDLSHLGHNIESVGAEVRRLFGVA